jgi:hypothetical protein
MAAFTRGIWPVRPSSLRRRSRHDPERLPLRWGVIIMAAAGAGAVAFAAGGPLAAIGVASLVATTLHKVLALAGHGRGR